MTNRLIVVKQVALSVLARRKKWVLMVSLLALCLALPVAYLMSKEPPRFRTSALILIESRPDRTPLFQEFSPFRPLAVQLAILNSRSLAESVIEALPRGSVEDLVQNPYDRDYVLEFQNTIRRLRAQEVVVESPQQRALAELQSARIRFDARGSTGIVALQAEASTPRVALDIANTYIEVLLSRTRSFNVDDTKVMREYLEQQLTQVSQAHGTNQEQLRQFTLARGGVKVPARNAETINRLTQIENALAEVQANRNMAQSRYAAMKGKLDAMPVAAPAPRVTPAASPVASARVQRLRARLAALEGQLLDFQSQYTDEHPRVLSVKRQIADLQTELGDAVKESSPPVSAASVTTVVPAQDRSAFAETVAALETSIHSLGAQEEALRSQAAALKRDLAGLSKDELEFTRLSTEAESSKRLSDVISEKLRAIKLREQGEMKVVKVIDPPSFPAPAMNAKRLRFLAVALGVSFLVGLGLPTAFEYFNRPVESEEDIRELLGVPVLAAVPRLNSGRAVFMPGASGADDAKHEDHFLFTEAFRRLRVELQLLGRDMPLKRVLVASSLPAEGKSTVVVNLGLAFGEVGKHVILADADFHRPTLHRTLKAPNAKGFSDLLAGVGELSESMTAVADGVWVSPRGGSPTALTRSGLGSRRLGEVLDRMAEEAEYVLVDSSPILLIPDNLHMAAAVDGVILVVHSGTTRPRDLLRTKELFNKTATPLLGVVLNQVPLRRMSQYYAYYEHYRAYVSGDSKK